MIESDKGFRKCITKKGPQCRGHCSSKIFKNKNLAYSWLLHGDVLNKSKTLQTEKKCSCLVLEHVN